MQFPYIGVVATRLHKMATLIYAVSIKTYYLLYKQIIIKWAKEKSFSLSCSTGIAYKYSQI